MKPTNNCLEAFLEVFQFTIKEQKSRTIVVSSSFCHSKNWNNYKTKYQQTQKHFFVSTFLGKSHRNIAEHMKKQILGQIGHAFGW